jgi:hypothetical protein
MKISPGSKVGTEYGSGIVVAVTKEWVIIKIEPQVGESHEIALPREHGEFWLLISEFEEGVLPECGEIRE